MFGNPKQSQELPIPPGAAADPKAIEILRVWAAPGSPQHVVLRPVWNDPGTWGLMLVDVARHASLAYKREGRSADEVLKRIRELFDAEWSSPTDLPEQVADGRMTPFKTAEAAAAHVQAAKIEGSSFELPIADEYTFGGQPDQSGAGLAVVLAHLLQRGFTIDGFVQRQGYRLYRYKRE